MKQPEAQIKKRIPIRRRFLTTVMLTTIISILATSTTGYFSIRWIRSAMLDTLTEQLEVNLKNIIEQRVFSVESKLAHYEKYVEFVTDSIENMYARKAELQSHGRMFDPPRNTREYELTRAFASAKHTAEELRDEMLFFSNMEKLWAPIAHENEDLISTMYIGTKTGLLVSYDRYSYLSCPPEGREVVYNYFVSEWYRRGIREDGILYTGVYMDSQGRGLTMTIASGFRNENGEVAGVACIDFDLTALYDELFASRFDDRVFTFALDHEDNIISPDSDTLELEDYTGLTLDELDELRANPKGIMEFNHSVYICIPIERVGWTLCASVPKDTIQSAIHNTDASVRNDFIAFIVVVFLILLAAVIAVNRFVTAITYPLELLGRDIKIISDGDLSYRASVYRNDEIGDITSGMNEMVDRLNFTMNELLSSQQQADAMSRLATRDSLTGIRNKTAFDKQCELLAEEIAGGMKEFGFAVLDLNNLKFINDNYGHEKGDIAIKNLCRIACEIFDHSPVFRVGGDEFVVLLMNEDYRNSRALVNRFKDRVFAISRNLQAAPWDRVSSAIGYALYDEKLDNGTESVLSRADKEMYRNKKAMKGISR